MNVFETLSCCTKNVIWLCIRLNVRENERVNEHTGFRDFRLYAATFRPSNIIISALSLGSVARLFAIQPTNCSFIHTFIIGIHHKYGNECTALARAFSLFRTTSSSSHTQTHTCTFGYHHLQCMNVTFWLGMKNIYGFIWLGIISLWREFYARERSVWNDENLRSMSKSDFMSSKMWYDKD